MTKPKPKPASAAAAAQEALEREVARRNVALKPIEIVKVAIGAHQAFHFDAAHVRAGEDVQSEDRTAFQRGTQASTDRVLFNVNYWRAAYEDRIVESCADPAHAAACLKAISAWNSHTMKLNTMSAEEVVALFERFCPPLVQNKRRGAAYKGRGRGPVQDFNAVLETLAQGGADVRALEHVASQVGAEAVFYDGFRSMPALDAFYDLLPAWCLQDRIELVSGTWWDDVDLMQLVAKHMHERFVELGHARPLCDYFHDAMLESLDVYTREMTTADNPYRESSVPQLVELVHAARSVQPDFETDGYGNMLPGWLGAKEQLVWNTVVCAVYGPMHARPLLADDLDLLPVDGKPATTDVITQLAHKAYGRYLQARKASSVTPEFETFESQPQDLRDSSLLRIESIPDKLKVLGFRVVPYASCYPEQRVDRLRPSEVECLAFLEHRRWLAERKAAGWTHADRKDVAAKQTPYLVEWDELPDRAKEWNRSSAKDIPALLASVGLAVSR